MTNPFLALMFCSFVHGLILPTPQFPSALNTLALDQNDSGPLSLTPSSHDPRFQFETFESPDDLSDKSSYMTCMKTMRDLALLEYTQPCMSGKYTNPPYGNVAVAISAISPRLETKHAMWAIVGALRFLDQNSFHASKLRLYWVEENQTPILFGEIYILGSPGSPNMLEFGDNNTAANLTSLVEVTQGATTNPPQLLFNSSVSDNDISIGPKFFASLGAGPRGKVFFEFEGARLPKIGVFNTLAASMDAYASIPRHPFLFSGLDIMHSERTVEITTGQYSPSIDPRSINYKDVIFMLDGIPRAMYEKNKFNEGTFVLEVEGRPIVHGKISKVRSQSLDLANENRTSVAVS